MEKCPLEGGASYRGCPVLFSFFLGGGGSWVYLFCRKRWNKQTPLSSTFEAVSVAKECVSYGMRLNELKPVWPSGPFQAYHVFFMNCGFDSQSFL